MSDQSTDPTVTYKDVPGFPGYRVGCDGSVWSRRPQVRGGGPLLSEWRLLRPVPRRGYLRVGLRSHVGANLSWLAVHRLVLEAFVGPCPDGMECLHGPDPDRTNNRVGNLRWGTSSENNLDKTAQGTSVCGSRHKDARLTESDIPTIRRLVASGESRRSVARRFLVHHQTISAIIRGISWKHVP